MKKIACIIVDDEPLARHLLARYTSRLAGWEAVASCRSVAEAYEALYQHSVDVLFLDINMPDRTGIDFLSTLRHPPLVVFTTAYAEYAAQAFDLNAVDYLVKPITEARFAESIAKVERLLQQGQPIVAAPETNHLFLKQDTRLVRVLYEDILYVEALKDFCKVYLKDRTMLASTHLKGMEDLLPPALFLRIHRSYVVAVNKITALQGNMVEIGRQALPVGSTYKEELLQRLRLL